MITMVVFDDCYLPISLTSNLYFGLLLLSKIAGLIECYQRALDAQYK